MKVMLYRVGRNLNRAYRTCEAFGVRELMLVECDGKLAGNLYRSKGRVSISELPTLACRWGSTLALETTYKTPLWFVDWSQVECILVGGESHSLPRVGKHMAQLATIPMQGLISGLTVEAALAIALYEWRRSCR